jgi:hypothetical protein
LKLFNETADLLKFAENGGRGLFRKHLVAQVFEPVVINLMDSDSNSSNWDEENNVQL